MSVSVTRAFQKKNEGGRGFRQQRTYDYLYGELRVNTLQLQIIIWLLQYKYILEYNIYGYY